MRPRLQPGAELTGTPVLTVRLAQSPDIAQRGRDPVPVPVPVALCWSCQRAAATASHARNGALTRPLVSCPCDEDALSGAPAKLPGNQHRRSSECAHTSRAVSPRLRPRLDEARFAPLSVLKAAALLPLLGLGARSHVMGEPSASH